MAVYRDIWSSRDKGRPLSRLKLHDPFIVQIFMPLHNTNVFKTSLPHVLFWAAVGVLMVIVFGASGPNGYSQSLLFVSLLLPVLAGCTYVIIYFLVPRFLLKGHFFLFGLYTVYAVIVAAWMEIMIVMGMLMLIYEYKFWMLNPRIHDMGYLTGTMALTILPAIAMHITRQWYREREVNAALRQEKLELELAARSKELDYLKEQMHPHFLFNALNNLYGLTLEKSDEAPELVLKLSRLLEYMLYESSKPMVPLCGELEHLRDYLEIQKIRCGDRLEVEWRVEGPADRFRIAPMLLLPFIENSFKHGISASARKSRLYIHLHIQQERLLGRIENTLPARKHRPEGEKHGVGLQNVRKRMQLLYGDDFRLDHGIKEQKYRVELSVPLKGSSDE